MSGSVRSSLSLTLLQDQYLVKFDIRTGKEVLRCAVDSKYAPWSISLALVLT